MTSTDNSPSNAPTDDLPKTTVARRLREAGLSLQRCHSLAGGSKNPKEVGWTEGLHRPQAVSQNWGIAGGIPHPETDYYLVVIDVDNHGDEPLPEWVKDMPETFVVRSPHGGTHRYYAVEGDVLRSRAPSWGDFQSQGAQAVGPGSAITNCKHGCCTPEDPGSYDVVADRAIASMTADDLVETVPGVRWSGEETCDGDGEKDAATAAEAAGGTVEWYEPDLDMDAVTNGLGMTLADVCDVSYRLHQLLHKPNPQQRYESLSEADMNTVYLLLGWHFEPDDVQRILRAYRDRKKFRRDGDDYVARTVAAARTDYDVDPIDPPLGHALLHSARENDGEGPQASQVTLRIVLGMAFDASVAAGGEPVTTRAVAEETGFMETSTDAAAMRRTRRALSILADAGYVGRSMEGREYRWGGFTEAEVPLEPFIEVCDDEGSRVAVGPDGATGWV